MIKAAWKRALLWPVRIERDIHCEFDFSQDVPDWPVPEGFSVRLGSPEDVMRIAELRLRDAGETVHAEYAERVRLGQKCFVAMWNGEVVGCDWTIFRVGYEGPVQIVLRDDEVMFQDAFIARAARGRAAHTAVHRAMLVWAKQQGYRIAYTFLGYGNGVASRAITRMGWRHNGRPRYSVVSSPMLRQFGVRHQLVLDHEPGRHPIPTGRLIRLPPFEREPWER